MMESLLSSAPDFKTIAQFLVINYAADFLVLGGAVYVYNKVKSKINQIRGKQNNLEEERARLRAVASLVDKNPEAVKELVNFVSSEVEKRVGEKLKITVDSYLREIEKDLKALRSIADSQDEQVHSLIASIEKTIDRTKRLRKEVSGKTPEEERGITISSRAISKP